jgi:hypothetical protein
MNQEPKNTDKKERTTQEELDELKEVMKKLKKLQDENKKNSHKNKQKRPTIAIEFGGVFHKNRYINLAFSAVVNLFFAYFVIEIFNFAEYHGKIYVLILLMCIYTLLEEMYRNMLLRYYFKYIIKSFGTIFFFGYLLIFFILDQFVFVEEFNFFNGTLLTFFVVIFVIVRYLFGTSVRKYFRRRKM